MTPKYRDEVNKILAALENEDTQDQEPKTATGAPDNGIEDIYVLIVRENADLEDTQVIDSELAEPQTTTPATPLPDQPPLLDQKTNTRLAEMSISIGMLIIFACLMFQFYLIFNPPTVTITLAARSQQLTLQGTLQLGRVLNAITLSQSQIVPTTGRGHQDARAATGYITFYNGSYSEQTVYAGTVFTGADGVQVITDSAVTIPADNPPVNGQATVPAHAINAGSAGNIQALDINGTISSSLFVKNLAAFTGGADERNYQTVTQSDVDLTASQLRDTLNQATQGALQGELKTGEVLAIPACSQTITPDHRPGEEATTVKVTVSETCSAVAYNQDALQAKVTQLLTTQATKKLGSGYSLLSDPQVTVTSATPAKQVMLSFTSVSTWVYALTSQEQEHIKTLIAGKYKQQALRLLHSLPGIESASLQFSGFGDATRIPKNINDIHLMLYIQSY